jgi:hypothetical protein
MKEITFYSVIVCKDSVDTVCFNNEDKNLVIEMRDKLYSDFLSYVSGKYSYVKEKKYPTGRLEILFGIGDAKVYQQSVSFDVHYRQILIHEREDFVLDVGRFTRVYKDPTR